MGPDDTAATGATTGPASPAEKARESSEPAEAGGQVATGHVAPPGATRHGDDSDCSCDEPSSPDHRWSRTFWDGSRYCEACLVVVDTRAPRVVVPLLQRTDRHQAMEAQQYVADILQVRAHPIDREGIAALEKRLLWSWNRTLEDCEVRRILEYLKALEARGTSAAAPLPPAPAESASERMSQLKAMLAESLAEAKRAVPGLAEAEAAKRRIVELEERVHRAEKERDDAQQAKDRALALRHASLAQVSRTYGPQERERLALRAALHAADALRAWTEDHLPARDASASAPENLPLVLYDVARAAVPDEERPAPKPKPPSLRTDPT